MQLNIELIMD